MRKSLKHKPTESISSDSTPVSLEEERIRTVLRELRTRNVNLDMDLARLERMIQSKDPSVQEIVDQIRLQSRMTPDLQQKVDRCRRLVEPKLRGTVRLRQKLLFGVVDLSADFPELYSSEDGSAIAVVGPRDLKRRTGGVLRIADHVVSVNEDLVADWLLVWPGPTDALGEAGCPRPPAPPNPARRSLLVVESRLRALARDPQPVVVFGILRDVVDLMALTGDTTQVEVIHLANDQSAGLGFGIVGGASTGVVVKTILPGSAADKDGKLHAGDRILQIGRINVQGMTSQQVAALLRQHDPLIELIVGRPAPINPEDSATRWMMPTRTALTPTLLEDEIRQRVQAASPPAAHALSTLAEDRKACNAACSSTAPNCVPTASTAPCCQPTDPARPGPKSTKADAPSSRLPSMESTDTLHRVSHQISGDVLDQVLSESGPRREESGLPREPSPSRNESTDSKQSVQPNSQSNSAMPSKTPSTDRPMSLKNLQEMALTTFCVENWIAGKFEKVDVTLDRDPVLGLGITVAGYVHKKEEIPGVFVKSLVPNSSAHLSRQIRVHDLIVEVNGKSLEKRRHADAVRTLVKSGARAALRMIRFSADSPQAICLKMLHEQEVAQQVDDVQSDLIDYKTYWQNRLGADFEVILVNLRPDRHLDEDAGLGLSLEGTVDIVDGTHLCPHHYIESLRKEGPAAKVAVLKAGDELLQINECCLYGESHVTVRQELGKAAAASNKSGRSIRLYLCRKVQQVNLYMPSPEQSLPLAYPLLAAAHDERLVKAKSELTISKTEPEFDVSQTIYRLRSRSLEQLSGLAIWNCVPIVVTLEKDSRGLGFSIVDYQDPLHPDESVIVIRSLVPGGVAQADGRIVPGDRLLFVNGEDLSSSTLQHAVDVLKAAPLGLVRIGIAKPVPVNELRLSDHSPIITRSERLLAKGSSPRSRRRKLHNLTNSDQFLGSLLGSHASVSVASSQEEVWIGADLYRRLNPQLYFPSSGSATPTTPRSRCSMFSWTPCSSRSVSPVGSPVCLKGSWASDVVTLPPHLERSIKVIKGALPLGIVLDADVDKAVNGCVVKNICSKKAVGRDGRIQVGDYVVRVNTENLRNVTNSQARAILKRTNLVGTQCNVTYITAADARLWKQRFHRESPAPDVGVSRLSPKVFPKFYRSPILDQKENTPETDFDWASLTESQMERVSDLTDDFFKAVLQDAVTELRAFYRTPEWSKPGEQTASSLQASRLSPTPEELASPSPISKVPPPIPAKPSSLRREPPAGRSPSPPLPPPPSMEVLDQVHAEAKKKVNGDLAHREKKVTVKEVSAEVEVSANQSHRQSLTTDASTNTLASSLSGSSNKDADSVKKRTNYWGEERTVVLSREPNETFGISIVGGRVEVSQKGGLPGTGSTVSGIFIKSVMPDSPAGRSSKMFMGDRVISVNEVDLRSATHEQAVHAIKNAANPVKFVVQSLQSFSPDKFGKKPGDESPRPQRIELIHQKMDARTTATTTQPVEAVPPPLESGHGQCNKGEICNQQPETSGPSSSSSTSIQSPTSLPNSTRDQEPCSSSPAQGSKGESEAVKEETTKTERSLEAARQSMRKKIERESAAALPKHPDDPDEEDRFCYTKRKIQTKYGDLPGEPTLIRLVNIPPKGLGLSLAGKNENQKKSVFVVDIKSTSPLPLQVGDELLEINGKVLFGLSHQTASVKIRECCEGDELALIILRTQKGAPQALVVDRLKEKAPATATSSAPMEAKKQGDDLGTGGVNELAPKLSLPANLSANQNGQSQQQHPSSLHDVSQGGLSSSITGRKKSWQQPPPMEKVQIETGKETLIEIDKDGKGLGLSIVGGSDTVLGSIVIHEVYPDGAAATDGRLKTGDQVLEVNGTSLRGLTHDQAISILRRTPAKVRMMVFRDVNLQMSLLDPPYNIHEIDIQKKPGRGLGISIVGRKDEPGVYISEIVKGGVAEADGRLLQGDQTISGKIVIRVGRWKLSDAANKAQLSQRASNPNSTATSPLAPRPNHNPAKEFNSNGTGLKSAAGDADEGRRVPSPAPQPSSGGYMAVPDLPQVTVQDESQGRVPGELSPVTEEPGSSSDLKSLSDPADIGLLPVNEEGSDNILIHLKKDEGCQWGMGIGRRPRGILVTSLQPGSTAAEKLQVGDRIMAVNGVAISDQVGAVTMVKSSGDRVTLQVARPQRVVASHF